ncbi:hypothetical protein QBC42DRAFT_332991 [Cladorrhinum samala]|uniref:NACHT domain-containing protein n=1 Tax=Cladorrhinum samala TaxID=585594 RepID=A0AAV9HXU5_9PEZI|nr:hypothetical protein QBC42DRAFT_332991 [Cladorrhinum samala]
MGNAESSQATSGSGQASSVSSQASSVSSQTFSESTPPSPRSSQSSLQSSQEVPQSSCTVLVPGGQNCNLDVVFVHGLRGHPIDTWSVDNVCWPRDLLKDDFPDARIISYGYDANIDNLGSNASQNGIFGHCQNLAARLAHLRYSAPDRPIIWIGHSLGGLVIKDAIISTNGHHLNERFEDYGRLYSSTIGVIFFGTPHSGSDGERLGQIVANIAKLVRKQPNSQLLATLAPDSHILEQQRDGFMTVTKDIPVVCFAEEIPWLNFGLIVPKSSALYTGFLVRPLSIHANHMNMVKFANNSSPGYIHTVGQMHWILQKFNEKQQQQQQQQQQQAWQQTPAVSQQRHWSPSPVNVQINNLLSQNSIDLRESPQQLHWQPKDILNLLWFDSIDRRDDAIKVPHQSTFSWIFGPFRPSSRKDPKPSSFVSWLAGGDKQAFWISGKPGSGKSTLMKSLYRGPCLRDRLNIWSKGKEVLLCGFFMTELGDPLQRSREGMLRTLLYRLINKKNELAEIAYPSLAHLPGPPSSLPAEFLSWDELKIALNKVLDHTQKEGWKVCIFVDGLDECRSDTKVENYTRDDMDELEWQSQADSCSVARNLVAENCREIVNYFVDELSQRPGLKLCVSSREITIFEENFAAFPRIRMHKHTQNDIKAYCSSTLSLRILGKVRAELIGKIVEQSDGVFLWVELVTKRINSMMEDDCEMADILKALDGLPRDLQGHDGLYMRMMNGLKATPDYLLESSRVLRLVLAASHWNKLDVRVASYALQHWENGRINVTKVKEAKINLASPIDLTELRERFQRRIKAHFGGLLECEAPEYKIEFVHKTAKDFVLRKTTWKEIFGQGDYDPNFDPDLALLAGHVMFIKTLGTKMVANSKTRAEFGSSYIWAMDAMHYAELVDSAMDAMHYADLVDSPACPHLKSYIGLVDELDRTMTSIAKLITPCAHTLENPQFEWPHYGPNHDPPLSLFGSGDHDPLGDRAQTFLDLAALGNLSRYIEQRLSDKNDFDRKRSATWLLYRILTFPVRHSEAHTSSKWTKAESVRRYTPIGCRLVNRRMMEVIIVHARRNLNISPLVHWWGTFLVLGWFCFPDPDYKPPLAEIGVVDHAPILRQNQVRWINFLKLLVQSEPDLSELQWRWAHEIHGLHKLLAKIPDDVKSEMELDSWLWPVLEPREKPGTCSYLLAAVSEGSETV